MRTVSPRTSPFEVCGSIRRVGVDSPTPLSTDAARNYLEVLRPELFWELAEWEVAALDAEADRRLGRDDEDGGL